MDPQKNVVSSEIISSELGIGKLIADLVVSRGYDTVSSARDFLYPDIEKLTPPSCFKGIDEACKLIKRHAENGRILVFGDYDCDGIGASAMLYLAFKSHGTDIDVYIPTRLEDGYGLSVGALKRAFDKYSPTLLMTVDCGIGSVEEIAYAKSLGIDTIVTDHHQPPDKLPDTVIINPKLDDELPELCGAGVAFTLIRALFGDEAAKEYIDICAVSTIADLVPLTGDNRIIASYGLKRLRSHDKRAGFKSLLHASGHKDGTPVTASDVAFRLAPRLNASGRLSDAYKSFRVLTEDDTAEVDRLTAELEEENRIRQELCNSTIADARRMLTEYDLTHRRIIVLYKEDWEAGVVGIAAAKIAEDFKRPTVLFVRKGNVLKGSCRSIRGVNIHDVLQAAESTLIQFGGHTMAAGLSLYPDNLARFTAVADAYIKANYADNVFMPHYEADAELDPDSVTEKTVDEIELLEPCGMGNPRPVFKSVVKALPFERIKNLQHIKSRFGKNAEIVAFNELKNLDILRSGMEKELYYTLGKEEFRARTYVRALYKGVRLMDTKPSDEMVFAAYAEKFTPLPEPEKVCGADSGYDFSFGRLLIAFRTETYFRLLDENPGYLGLLSAPTGYNPYNAVILSPALNADFRYYSVIEVFDSPPAGYVEYLKKRFGASVTAYSGGALRLPKGKIDLSRDALVKLFSYLKTFLDGKKVSAEEDVYYIICMYGYDADYYTFLACWYVLREIGVASFCGSTLMLSRDKKNLGASRILQIVSEK